MKNTILTLIVAALAFTSAVIGGLLVAEQNPAAAPVAGGATDSVAFTTMGTSSTMTVFSGRSARILATSTEAQWRSFQNISANPVFLKFSSDTPAATSSGFILNASSTLQMSLDQSNMYRGSVTALSIGGDAQVLVNQK